MNNPLWILNLSGEHNPRLKELFWTEKWYRVLHFELNKNPSLTLSSVAPEWEHYRNRLTLLSKCSQRSWKPGIKPCFYPSLQRQWTLLCVQHLLLNPSSAVPSSSSPTDVEMRRGPQMFVLLEGHQEGQGKWSWNSKGHCWTEMMKIAHMLSKTQMRLLESLAIKSGRSNRVSIEFVFFQRMNKEGDKRERRILE